MNNELGRLLKEEVLHCPGICLKGPIQTIETQRTAGLKVADISTRDLPAVTL
jgi:hypothetical protein